MCGIDAQHRQFLGEEGKFFKREHERTIVWMSLDVRIELRGEEIAANHIAFEFGHVHAVGSEPSERLVERSRHVTHPEHKGRNDLALTWMRPFFLSRQHDEARGGMRFVFDIFLQDVEAINFRRQP